MNLKDDQSKYTQTRQIAIGKQKYKQTQKRRVFDFQKKSAGKMTDIELTYFPVHGYRGLMTRLVLDFGGIEYSEKIVGIKEWPMKKGGEFEK